MSANIQKLAIRIMAILLVLAKIFSVLPAMATMVWAARTEKNSLPR